MFGREKTRNTLMTCVRFQKWKAITQLTFSCLKSTMEALEEGVKYVQS